MKQMLLVVTLIAAAAAPAQATQDAAVETVVSHLQRGLDRDLLVRMSFSALDPLMKRGANEPAGGHDAASSLPVVQTEVAARVTATLHSFYNSRAFTDSVLRPWVTEAFTPAEIAELADFLRSGAGKKFASGIAIGPIVERSLVHLDAEIGRAVFGASGEELMRMPRFRRTAADLRTIGAALEAYATDHNGYPAASSIEGLKPFLSPAYVRRLPERDAWERAFVYAVTPDGKHYRIASGGPDGVLTSSSFDASPARLEDDATADLVYQDGRFVVIPASMSEGSRTPFTSMAVSGALNVPVTTLARPLPEGYERVGGDVRAPVVIHRVEPLYTAEARAARVSGIVIVEALIDVQGNVASARVLKPLPFGLDQAALEAIGHWKFQPATKNGVTVPVAFNLTMNFRLE